MISETIHYIFKHYFKFILFYFHFFLFLYISPTPSNPPLHSSLIYEIIWMYYLLLMLHWSLLYEQLSVGVVHDKGVSLSRASN